MYIIPYSDKYVKTQIIPANEYILPKNDNEDGHTVLSDTKLNRKTGKMEERPWSRYKRMSQVLYKIYGHARDIDRHCITYPAYLKLENCSSWLIFKQFRQGGVKRLNSADFCRHRLCPTCNWRKSLKMYSQMQVVSKALMDEFPTARYLFGTFTVKNCTFDELEQVINDMMAAFKLLVNKGKNNASCKELKSSLMGYAKALEINYDSEEFITEERYKKTKSYCDKHRIKVGDLNPNCGMYHPHLHVLFMVSSNYFAKQYINQTKWTYMWRDCMKLDYNPIVNIKIIKPNAKDLQDGDGTLNLTDEEKKQKSMGSAISETLKYPVKPDSLQLDKYDDMDDEQQRRIVDAVITLSHALKKRRLITFGGEILKMRKILQQTDVEEDDLIITGDEEEPTIETEFDLVYYNFCQKAGVYIS